MYGSPEEARLAFLRQTANTRELTLDELAEAFEIARGLRGKAMSHSATSRLSTSAVKVAAGPQGAPKQKVSASAVRQQAVQDALKNIF